MNQEHDIITSDYHPNSNILHHECDKYIILIGSLSSILKNKHINQTALLIHILDDEPTQELFLHITGIDTLQELLAIILNRYPQLCTSKTVSNFIRGKNDQRRR